VTSDYEFMRRAIALAEQAAAVGEVPVGALVVKDGEIIGEGYNQPINSCDPTGHAEIVAMRNASAAVQNYRLSGCDLYVTIEPCTMCVGAMIHARIGKIIFGAPEPRAGALESQLRLLDGGHYNHSIDFQGGVLAEECGEIISSFFRRKRAKR
jgi:tRNA(adenine34) deaminase